MNNNNYNIHKDHGLHPVNSYLSTKIICLYTCHTEQVIKSWFKKNFIGLQDLYKFQCHSFNILSCNQRIRSIL